MRSILQVCALASSFLFIFSTSARAQKGFFTEVNESVPARKMAGQVSQFKTFTINVEALKTYLGRTKNSDSNGELALEVPLYGDKVETFIISESQVLAPEIAQRMPGIKTYSGRSVGSGYTIKLTLTPEGFNALLLNAEGNAIIFEKVKEDNSQNIYRSYSSADVTQSPYSRSCGDAAILKGPGNEIDQHSEPADAEHHKTAAKFSNGTGIKRYRLAIGATGEFTNTFGNGNVTAAYAAVVAYVNEINAVYEQELGVTFQLVTDQTYVFPNPATDPYADGSNVNQMLGENQTLMDGTLGAANYDIGHAFSGTSSSSGGGVAYAGVLCWPGYKAGGASDIGNETYYHRVFSIQLIAHELGHMFSMSHSYNSNIPVCTTRELITSVEPGAGATIMSYGFTCGSDDYSSEYDGLGKRIGPFLNFHVKSIEQALTYMAQYGICSTTVPGTNSVPVIASMQTSYTIPKLTPFALSGTATDVDNDPLSYSWEGTDISDEANGSNLTPAILTDPAHPPFFRSYQPAASGIRTYPLLEAILNGTNTSRGDKLPSVAFATHHTLTVRDGRGGAATEDVVVSVDGSGPFLITNDPSGTYTAGGNIMVQWSVNNTDQSPVSCTLVDILLSQDGGLTFPVTLASAIPNAGAYSVVLPSNVTTTQARLKIMPATSTTSGNVPNIFFDISNENFTISSALPISLHSFEALAEGKDAATLLWKTTRELNTAGFEIEMGTDGDHFYKLGYQASKGSAGSDQNYTYQVQNLLPGKYFFRLKQVANDGSYTYSSVRSVMVNGDRKVVIYPNPASDHLFIEGIQAGCYIVISDVHGKVLKKFVATSVSEKIDVAHWAKGIYFIAINSTTGTNNLYKIVKAE